MEFTKELALQLIQSNEDFPVSFDAAWEWLGYSRKDAAKRAFLNFGYIQNVDYTLHNTVESAPNGGLTHREDIKLTIDALKTWGMQAQTEKGKLIRAYFLEVEKEYRKIQEQPKLTPFQEDMGNAKSLLSFLDEVGVHKPLAATKLLQIVGERHNTIHLTDVAKSLVGNANPEVDKYYNATEIGEFLVPPVGSRKINPLLASKGLLSKNGKGEWELTEYGKQFGVLIPYTASNKRSGFQIKWKADVIPLLQTPDPDDED